MAVVVAPVLAVSAGGAVGLAAFAAVAFGAAAGTLAAGVVLAAACVFFTGAGSLRAVTVRVAGVAPLPLPMSSMVRVEAAGSKRWSKLTPAKVARSSTTRVFGASPGCMPTRMRWTRAPLTTVSGLTLPLWVMSAKSSTMRGVSPFIVNTFGL